jgi:hypothetical protein
MPVLVVQEQRTKAVMAGILDGDYGLTRAGEAAEALMLDLFEFGASKTLNRVSWHYRRILGQGWRQRGGMC